MTAPPSARRTSPRIVLVHTVTFRQARQFVPVLIPIGAATGFGGGTGTVIALVVAVTLFSLAAAAVTWWRFGYADGPTAVVVTRGLLSRSVRTVPNDRIRGVEVEAPALHRLFGLVRVRIDAAAGTAAGQEEELVVDGVPRAEGDRLRVAVLTHRSVPPAQPDAGAPAPPEEELSRWDNRWLFYAPLVGSYLALPLAGIGALFRLGEELPDDLLDRLPDVDVPSGWVIGAVVLGMLLLVLAGAVVGAAIVNWGFRLVLRGSTLVAVRGLFTRRHTELELDRIRGVAVSEGLGMRLVGAARAGALVTGLGDAERRGQLLPLGPRADAWTLTHRLVDDPGPLRAHPSAALRRRIVRALTVGLSVSAGGAVLLTTAGRWDVLLVGIALTVLGVPLAYGLYGALGHAAGPHSFSVRRGWLVREQVVLEQRAVVGWEIRQSVFQRRAGLATVTACVGAGSGGYAAVDMAAGDVAAFTLAASEPWAGALARPRRDGARM
ncbi:PH domain-containing protein [Blastococcus sp. VKM Ac-2987]|uniref:PH domain-containing protein n=1 Tax=Blastococcus sp. VKM Ac-2987 TaxID=3004141 RepID=UPI0022ABB29E|nr:PH domain-containing protein [Blastococcus sp. VKM Ac-2987]MCZ2858614.1 PH domain-containing protein [Blastococcus sp. VKM Ac-2987]